VLLALGWYDYEVNRGVAAYAREANWVLNDMAGHTRGIPLHWRCDGILASLPRAPEPDQARLLKRGVPVVDLRIEHPQPLPRVVLDNEAIGRLGAEHFLSRGFTDLGVLPGLPGARWRWSAWPGYRRAVEEAGKTFHHINMAQARPRRSAAATAGSTTSPSSSRPCPSRSR
jgi:DNA-binding LacI/PurR family transcriptional regulator